MLFSISVSKSKKMDSRLAGGLVSSFWCSLTRSSDRRYNRMCDAKSSTSLQNSKKACKQPPNILKSYVRSTHYYKTNFGVTTRIWELMSLSQAFYMAHVEPSFGGPRRPPNASRVRHHWVHVALCLFDLNLASTQHRIYPRLLLLVCCLTWFQIPLDWVS